MPDITDDSTHALLLHEPSRVAIKTGRRGGIVAKRTPLPEEQLEQLLCARCTCRATGSRQDFLASQLVIYPRKMSGATHGASNTNTQMVHWQHPTCCGCTED